jgi:hypothetical protein
MHPKSLQFDVHGLKENFYLSQNLIQKVVINIPTGQVYDCV